MTNGVIKRYIFQQTLKIIGFSKASMVAKVGLVTGDITGMGYMINDELKRNHERNQNQANREHQSAESQKTRDFQGAESAHTRAHELKLARMRAHELELARIKAQQEIDLAKLKASQNHIKNPFKNPFNK